MMSVKFALAGLAILGGAALMAQPASAAMPNGIPAASHASGGVENVRWVCGPYNCWWQPRRSYRPYAYYAPRPFYGRSHWRHRHWDRRW